MQLIINAIDKAVRAGVYTLEETSQIINEINRLSELSRGAIVKENLAKNKGNEGSKNK